ncbi:phospho-2-dehydro-3-deoxyheptonate aldolase [Xylanimonas cellulosilytica DSM 15894]|uniref:Phospho-2-dehydro-3-deoxyheptonate aldolase n=1 Tax=Xylanimonas cellulosilytica (strain DSM 15894 / JCM 12276 / CECT 5975 / KCTC 9989 / LMG 20990 / NBRC 107835 / XIL07) TaxID=446471 RepID=D1BZT6_XYLCX|nr:3-deoxy-7-phosphoheptulonate synthase [Xylanimonas cellulosilytica]ACZ32064.1 phospho-2-dehydro-3-deoxyheptonate aldolase [Xylanimonas cellulosilytica DSM 15894]
MTVSPTALNSATPSDSLAGGPAAAAGPAANDRKAELLAETSDLRIRALDALPAPRDVRVEQPLGTERSDLVAFSRREVRDVLTGEDDRLLVIVGPCSVHDPAAALDYASRLALLARELADELVVVMRVYFEKPRTTVGWKGLINDPHLDGSHDVLHGLRLAREVLLGVLDAGVPAATEFLEPTSPQYIADAVTWGAIGARNVESQVHRQLASGLSMPVGMKNATDGDVQTAVDACITAASEHTFFGADSEGRAASVTTAGNPDCHIILRGGRSGPNYSRPDVEAALDVARRSGLVGAVSHGLIVDASHGNSGKDHVRQAAVVRELAARLAEGEQGITGLMMESFIEAGAQNPGPLSTLTYGRSVTDKCIDWDTTADLLRELADAVGTRRAL